MTNNPCNPNAGPAIDFSNPCALLPLYREALFKLMTGSAQAEVRHGDMTLRFHSANVAQVRAEVIRLEHMCNSNGTQNNKGRAVQVQHRPRTGFGPDAYFTNRYR